MTVKELKALINGLPDETEVFVGCQGYTNYDFKSGKPYENSETNAIVHDGKFFLLDDCAIVDTDGNIII